MTIRVDALDDDEHGVRVADTAEGEAIALRTDRPVAPTAANGDAFTMPVDTAVELDVGEFSAPLAVTAIFRRDGEVVHRAESAASVEPLPRGTYEVDFSPPGVKLYVRVEGAEPAVEFVDGHTRLEFGDATRVVLGVRSMHESPAGTVTVTEDPRDLMRAVSTFGSALKTQTPDRSWPTLRGHPPAIELGSHLHVPAEVEPPETGVRIEVPPEYGAIYTVAPLAYYLGATVLPGNQSRLVADGETYEFDSRALAEDVRSVLEHVFTLDCVVREAGVFSFRTEASEDLEARVALDYERLFELSLSERTAAYLRIPRSATEGLVAWHYTADVAAAPSYAAALPYLVDELAVVRSPPRRTSTVELTPSPNALQAGSALVRSVTSETPDPLSGVVPEDADTPGHSWVAGDFAPSAANPTVGSFRRGFEWPTGDGPLDIHVVYNDARLEASDETAYDIHPASETDVRVSHGLSTAELREALYAETDFLHFVGHVTDDGMVCPDGVLDTRTLAKTGVKAFFLNGCRSYEQGRALLTAGAVGGIATADDVSDDDAGRAGHAVSMLLDSGFPLYAALDVLGRTGLRRDRYAILGSGTLAFRASETGTPFLYETDTAAFDADTDPIPVTGRYYPYGVHGIGAFVHSTYATTDAIIASGRVRCEQLPRADLERSLDVSPHPMLVDGELRYTPNLTMADFS
ncbi:MULTISPECIES: hypothetical protein [Halobacterium]|uniref:hypothetical protein n=1 Tax=Halobacterium TaxID=2239 RepID=UPI00073EAF69|nr:MULTISPECIES: hypothetical protein [Halobacterium]MCG1004246.1 hypothetical protein [Halobacterium noricense]